MLFRGGPRGSVVQFGFYYFSDLRNSKNRLRSLTLPVKISLLQKVHIPIFQANNNIRFQRIENGTLF